MLIRHWTAVAVALLCATWSVLAQTCPPTGVTIGVGTTMCLCNSGYINTNSTNLCASRTICPAPLQTTDTGLNSRGNATNIVVTNSRAFFTVKTPQVATRRYTGLMLGNCTQGQFSTSVAVVSPNDTSCTDVFNISLPVSRLERCGLTQQRLNDTFATYQGYITLSYNETLPGISTMERTGKIIVPVALSFRILYSASFTTGAVKVNSKFNITGIITYQDSIFIGSTQLQMEVRLATQVPYAIVGVPNRIAQDGPAALAGAVTYFTTAIDGSIILPNQTNILTYPTCQAPTDGYCYLSLPMIIILNGACRVNDAFTISNVQVTCSADTSSADCPLRGVVDSNTNVTFAITSANLCLDPASLVNIGSASVQRFIAVAKDNLKRTNTQPKNSYSYNDPMYLRLDFDTFIVYAATLVSLRASVNLGLFLDAPVYPKVNGSINTAAGEGTTSIPTSRQYGLDFTDQSFLMRTYVNGNLSTQLVRGVTQLVRLQAIMTLNYNAATSTEGANRVRRRMVVGTGQPQPAPAELPDYQEHHRRTRQSSDPPGIVGPIVNVTVTGDAADNPGAGDGGGGAAAVPVTPDDLPSIANSVHALGKASCMAAAALVVMLIC